MAQLGVTARWVEEGTERHGEFVYMDLLSRRTGAWQIVRTLSARVR